MALSGLSGLATRSIINGLNLQHNVIVKCSNPVGMVPIVTGAVHLTDLASPTFSPEAQMIIDGMAAMADYCPLTTALHEQASAQTGLSDFGDQDYRERMDGAAASVRRIARLHAIRSHVRILADADLPQGPASAT